MISAELLRRIRRIEIRTRRLVSEAFVGAYHSTFKGRGIAFDTVRPYEPGDDVRSIDWNVTARAGEVFVKKYTEERELTVLLVLDGSASVFFGTTGREKREVAAELGAVLALAAIRNNDKVGLLIFSDRIEHYTAPRKGRNHVLRLIRDVIAERPAGRGTDLALALRTVSRMAKQRAIVFVISDFLALSAHYETELRVVSRRHDVIAVVLSDPREQAWPHGALVALEDAETGEVRLADTASMAWRAAFAERSARFRAQRDSVLARAAVGRVDIATDGDIIAALTAFFRARSRR